MTGWYTKSIELPDGTHGTELRYSSRSVFDEPEPSESCADIVDDEDGDDDYERDILGMPEERY